MSAEREIEASEFQGITAIAEALKVRGIDSEIDQTGGFTMVGRVQLGDDAYPYLGFISECVVLYLNDEDEGQEIAVFNPTYSAEGRVIAQSQLIAQTVETALEAFSTSREDEDNLACLVCGFDGMTIRDGRLTIQAGTYIEFICNDCFMMEGK